MGIKEWVKYCQNLRNKVVRKESDGTKILLANFEGTEQQKDIEKRTKLLGKNFYRIKVNVKSFSNNERKRGEKKLVDSKDNQAVFNTLAEEFDIPYWAFTALSKKSSLQDYNDVFMWQLKACNLYCPWCYVDDVNKNSKQNNSAEFFFVNEIINSFEKQREKQTLNVIRPSGGEPTLAIEQWLESLKELKKRGLNNEIYVQGDTNLTTGQFIKHLEETNQIEKNLLKKVGEYKNFGLLCSFKGTDIKSFLKESGLKNKKFSFLEQERWNSFEQYVNAGIDIYPFVYATNPKTIESFMEKGAKRFGDGFWLKTWIFPLKLYGPEKQRLIRMEINSEKYQQELNRNFQESKEIMQNLIWKKFRVNYQAVPRTGIRLKKNN